MKARCPKRVPVPPTPPSLPVDAAKTHPRYRHLFEPGARCELAAGHADRHKSGLLFWHDPPVLLVGGERVS